jgi:hypothetical protein
MPPAAAADTVATIARVEQHLAGVATRYVAQSADLTRRALAAEVGDAAAAAGRGLRAAYGTAGEALGVLGLADDLLGEAVSKGRFNFSRWILGGHRWGYRNGLKSQLRRDWNNLRGIARGRGSAWQSFVSDVKHEARGVERAVLRVKKTLGSDVKVVWAKEVRSAARSGALRYLGRAGTRLVGKVMIPMALYQAYHDSKAVSWEGRATSAVLSTAVDLVPVVALVDVVSGDGVSGAFDADVSAAESLATGDASYSRAMDAVQSGGYGPFWQAWEGLWSQ